MRVRLFLAALLVMCGEALADPVDDVRCREIGFSLAAEARSAARFTTFIDADARFVGNRVTRGPIDITEAWGTFFADGGPAIKWRPQFVEVLEDGSLALTRGPYRMIVTEEDGSTSEHWGTFNSVWRKQADGSWKVVFDAGSPSAAPPPADVRALLDDEHGCPSEAP
jgi:ketosteroid isomerase-like protein